MIELYLGNALVVLVSIPPRKEETNEEENLQFKSSKIHLYYLISNCPNDSRNKEIDT